MIEVVTDEPAATIALAGRLAAVARPGDVICLWGELGAGKTTFAKGFAAGLGVAAVVNSPSFILEAEYEGRLPLFHLDLYRLHGPVDAVASGLLDERQVAGVTLVEWPDRMGEGLPSPRLDVRIGGTGDETRRIRIEAGTPDLIRYEEAAA